MWQPIASPITHACLLIHAGSRDEDESEYGIAHFIEHLLFKKTEKRGTYQILNRLESVGADLNAYTSKEYTCLHASFLNPYLNRTLDLFEDILFHSQFPEDEIEKERGVILDEISSYLDSPEEAILDDFEDQVFDGHGLGHNILGYKKQVRRFKRQNLINFLEKKYSTEGLVIGITGNYTRKYVVKICEKIFGHLPAKALPGRQIGLMPTSPRKTVLDRPINQVHHIVGATAYSLHDEKRFALMFLNNYLGGMGMSSRLNMLVREKHGIAYTIESSYHPFTDTGLFHIYVGTDLAKFEKAEEVIFKELKRLREKPLTVRALQHAKTKFKGQIALGEENRMGLIISHCKNLMDYQFIPTLDEIFQKIDVVSADDVREIAQEIFREDRFHSLTFKPRAKKRG